MKSTFKKRLPSYLRSNQLFTIVSLLILGTYSSLTYASNVTVAGFSFAGDFATAKDRFPHSYSVFQELNKSSAGEKSLSFRILERSKLIKNPNLEFSALDTLVNLKNDQALMSVLVLTGETVSTENFGAYYKTFVNLRGDVLMFDYKSKNVVRSYPISVVIFDATNAPPSKEEITGFVKDLMVREDGNGLITQFTRRMTTATLPSPGNRNIQIKKSEITPEALALMPEGLRQDPKMVESMLADAFASILAAKVGVPMLPASIGHTLGTMSLRLENGDDVVLKIGEGDYLFDIKLNKFAKLKSGESNLGTSYVFGAYASIHFYEPTQNTQFVNTDLKNGEVKIFPAGQVSGEDFPAYEAAIRGLYLKFADAVQGGDLKWINTAASAKDINQQIEITRNIIKASR
ncbi:MAG: hypothetical protein K2P84_01515 [Undibacterium sp.]|nr:hypothetical protein [Undibacterium sp.]